MQENEDGLSLVWKQQNQHVDDNDDVIPQQVNNFIKFDFILYEIIEYVKHN